MELTNLVIRINYVEGDDNLRKILFLIATLTLLLVIIIGLSTKGNKNNTGSKYNKITPQEAKEMMDTEEVIIVDVRTPEEYEEGYIEGAILIPNYDIETSAATMLPDKDAKILLYCRSGNRSQGAAKSLVKMGYNHVYDFGGIGSWVYEIIKD